jgi:hypothetical protein
VIAAVVASSSLASLARAQLASDPRPAGDSAPVTQASAGDRPAHIWTTDYASLVFSDTKWVFTAPMRWETGDWLEVGEAVTAVGATTAFDHTIRRDVQDHRSPGQDRFMKQWQELGNYYAFATLAAFDAWGEMAGDVRAKNAAMDGIAASIIAGGLVTPMLKVVAGRERPSTTTASYRYKPFSKNASFPSGHTTEAFAVATAIAENYRVWWVQGLAYGAAGLVGYARVEQNAHFASDVLAGGIVGWSVARGVVHRNDKAPDPRKLTWTPYFGAGGMGIVLFKSF